MIWQLGESPISFLNSLSIGELNAVALLVDQSSLLGEFKSPLGRSLLGLLLLNRLRCLGLFLHRLFLLGLPGLLGWQLHQGLLGIYCIIRIAFEFELGLHDLSFHLKENQYQNIKLQIFISTLPDPNPEMRKWNWIFFFRKEGFDLLAKRG